MEKRGTLIIISSFPHLPLVFGIYDTVVRFLTVTTVSVLKTFIYCVNRLKKRHLLARCSKYGVLKRSCGSYSLCSVTSHKCDGKCIRCGSCNYVGRSLWSTAPSNMRDIRSKYAGNGD